MLLALVMNFVVDVVAMVLSILPSVGVADIPYVGEFVAQYFTLANGYLQSAMLVLPFMQVVWTCFVYVVIPFEFGLLIAKFFFGSRTPTNV